MVSLRPYTAARCAATGGQVRGVSAVCLETVSSVYLPSPTRGSTAKATYITMPASTMFGLAALTMWCAAIVAATEGTSDSSTEREAMVVTVGVRLPSGRAEEIERRVWAVADPRSAQYGKHLGRDEVRALRASDKEDVREVVAWLT